MRRDPRSLFVLLALSPLAVLDSGCAKAIAQSAAPADGPAAVELTVYKEDFAMVHERRNVSVAEGSNHLRLDDVSQSLDPSSVMFRTPKGSEVVGSTYDLGVGSGTNLMKRLSGRNVELIWSSDNGREGDRIHGRLEPAADGGFLIRAGDKVYVNPKGTLVAPSDDALSTLPGLAVQMQSDAPHAEALDLSYLTRGMSWSADYVAHLDPDRDEMRLECWAAVTNQTGVPFRDAKITFVAGSPNRAARVAGARYGYGAFQNATKAEAADAMPATINAPPTPVGELYEYKAPSPATIGVDQMSRVRMFHGASVPIRRDYSVRLPGLNPFGYDNSMTRTTADLAIAFDNRKASGLGFPLPSGAVRVFESDGDSDRYVGADTIPDLTLDGRANMTLSKVFDLSAEPTVVSSRRLDKHTMEKRLRVIVRNGKRRDVKVRLVQGISSRWSLASGDKPERLNAETAQWTVTVPAGGQKTLDSTLDLKY